MEQYIIRYHHGGTLLREEGISYINGSEVEVTVDLDKLCYWDLLGDLKEMGYGLEKLLSLFFVDYERSLRNISDDDSTIALAEMLRRQHIVDVYVETSNIMLDIRLPDMLMLTKVGNVELADVVELDAKRNNVELNADMPN
ncbi:hypothetical protein IHE45_07G056500 [Dioscorea alata]|uniref:Uncharacterized protein n=1 Tax=Dioscorea alata TaxID=55571 RepID=A0ACB7VQX0_DIOAL|nr:hypothetical protein IHE45_07G056500 [Dioscorea alata]